MHWFEEEKNLNFFFLTPLLKFANGRLLISEVEWSMLGMSHENLFLLILFLLHHPLLVLRTRPSSLSRGQSGAKALRP